MKIGPRSPGAFRSTAPRRTSNRLSASTSRPPADPLFTPRTTVSQATPIGVPAPPPAHWPAWASFLSRQMPRLAFPMFCVVAAAPSFVVMAVPLTLMGLGLPSLSGLGLGVLAIGLTWGGLAILMRYQEQWESAPPEPRMPWTPPSASASQTLGPVPP